MSISVALVSKEPVQIAKYSSLSEYFEAYDYPGIEMKYTDPCIRIPPPQKNILYQSIMKRKTVGPGYEDTQES